MKVILGSPRQAERVGWKAEIRASCAASRDPIARSEEGCQLSEQRQSEQEVCG